ncbi:MAG: epoxyqueuosine reductase [Firmicutes bacterium]|nr:epoxyqueuosine reductase [Bacillota bacterium]
MRHPAIRNLKQTAGEHHQMPEDVMEDAVIVLVYFVPFQDFLSKENKDKGLATKDWAQAYETTNAMFSKLNQHLIRVIEEQGFSAKESPEARIFYRDEVISHWSFRHFAYTAGLGTFGLNNMLITEQGCAGRINGLVTNLRVSPDQPQQEEACLFKRNGSCGLCLQVCPAKAITEQAYDRRKCYAQCLKNAEVHTGLGSSYSQGNEAIGSEVCGKCVAGMPCALKRP